MTRYVSAAAWDRLGQWFADSDLADDRPFGPAILRNFEIANDGLIREQSHAFMLLAAGAPYRTLTSVADVEDAFLAASLQLRETACLALLAALEADLKADYLNRVGEKRKDPLSILYRTHFSQKKTPEERRSVSITRFVLPTLKAVFGGNGSPERLLISQQVGTVGALMNQFRNWAAHGQLLVCVYEADPDPADVFAHITDMLRSIPQLPQW